MRAPRARESHQHGKFTKIMRATHDPDSRTSPSTERSFKEQTAERIAAQYNLEVGLQLVRTALTSRTMRLRPLWQELELPGNRHLIRKAGRRKAKPPNPGSLDRTTEARVLCSTAGISICSTALLQTRWVWICSPLSCAGGGAAACGGIGASMTPASCCR